MQIYVQPRKRPAIGRKRRRASAPRRKKEFIQSTKLKDQSSFVCAENYCWIKSDFRIYLYCGDRPLICIQESFGLEKTTLKSRDAEHATDQEEKYSDEVFNI